MLVSANVAPFTSGGPFRLRGCSARTGAGLPPYPCSLRPPVHRTFSDRCFCESDCSTKAFSHSLAHGLKFKFCSRDKQLFRWGGRLSFVATDSIFLKFAHNGGLAGVQWSASCWVSSVIAGVIQQDFPLFFLKHLFQGGGAPGLLLCAAGMRRGGRAPRNAGEGVEDV